MFADDFVVGADLLVRRSESLTEDSAGADRMLSPVGDILDLAVAVHILGAEVTAA